MCVSVVVVVVMGGVEVETGAAVEGLLVWSVGAGLLDSRGSSRGGGRRATLLPPYCHTHTHAWQSPITLHEQ